MIVYQLPEGYDSFTATGYVTQEIGSVTFGVLVDKGTLNFPDNANVKVNFEDIGKRQSKSTRFVESQRSRNL